VASLVSLVPAFLQVAAAAGDEVVRSRAQRVVNELQPKLDQTPPLAIVTQVSEWVQGFCAGSTGARNGACTSITNLIANAATHIGAGRLSSARDVLGALADRAVDAQQTGALTAPEAQLIGENARYVIGRL
jgi:hypothetical protein